MSMNLPNNIIQRVTSYLVSRGYRYNLEDMAMDMVEAMVHSGDDNFYHAYRDVINEYRKRKSIDNKYFDTRIKGNQEFEVVGFPDMAYESYDIDLLIDISDAGEDIRLFSEGYLMKEIAEMQGIKESAVCQRIRKQMGKLQESYLGYRKKFGHINQPRI